MPFSRPVRSVNKWSGGGWGGPAATHAYAYILRLKFPPHFPPILPTKHHVSLFISFLRSLSYSPIIIPQSNTFTGDDHSASYPHQAKSHAIRLFTALIHAEALKPGRDEPSTQKSNPSFITEIDDKR
jgi:hypothetical protein